MARAKRITAPLPLFLAGFAFLAGSFLPAQTPPSAIPAPTYAKAKERLTALPASSDFFQQLKAASAELEPLDAARLLMEFAPKCPAPSEFSQSYRAAAELSILLGAFADAARAFEAAGLLEPRDGAALLSAARAYLAAGEDRRAAELAAIVLSAPPTQELAGQARLVAAWAALFGGNPASARALAATLVAPKPAPGSVALDREARFLLWITALGADRERAAAELAAIHPESPEAKIAASAREVRLAPFPHWYLGLMSSSGPALAATPAPAPSAPIQSPAKPVSPPASPPPASPAASAPPVPPTEDGSSQPRLYQLGIFSQRENAEALVAELKKKGFSPRIEERKLSGKTLLAVVIEAGKDPASTGIRLKDAGYEAYPLF